MTMATFTQQVLLAPLCGAFLRFYAPAREGNDLNAYLDAVRALLGRATITLVAVTGSLAVALWLCGHAEWIGLVSTALILSLLFGYRSAIDSMQIAARQRAIVAWHQGIGEWLRFLGAVAAVTVLAPLGRVAILGYAAGTALTIGSQLLFFRSKTLPKNTAHSLPIRHEINPWTEPMRLYARPFSVWGLFTFVQASSDRWALQTFASTSAVGLYAVVYQLGYYSMGMISGSMLQLSIPVLFHRAGAASDARRMNEVRRLTHQLVLATLAITLLGTTLAFFWHQRLFRFLVAPEFRSVSPLLPWMVLAGGLFGCGQAASQALLSGVDTRCLMTPKIVTAVAGTLLSGAAAYRWGLHGVVFAGVLFSLMYFGWMFQLARQPEPGPGAIRVEKASEARDDVALNYAGE